MMSRLNQYLNEISTCQRMAADWHSCYQLVKRTQQFHLKNLVRSKRTESTTAEERHRVMLNKQPRDLWLRPGTGDMFIFHEIFTNECYRIPESILPRAQTILDLGANIGLTTVFLAQFFPDAKYVCVEPNPFNAAVLRRNVAWLGDQVTVIECAVANYCGDISFTDADWSWGGHVEPGKTGNRTVPCLTVGKILESQGLQSVDLLKVDIEGAEALLFSDRAEWLKNIGCIVIELHGQYNFSQLEKELSPLGFTVLPEGSEAGNVMNMALSGDRARQVSTLAHTRYAASAGSGD